MKIIFIYTERKEVSDKGESLYQYTFGVKKTSEDKKVQRVFGNMTIASGDPLAYKVNHGYEVILSDLLTLPGPGFAGKLN